MSSTGYITFPQQTDPRDLMARMFTYLQAKIPGWVPAEGNLDVWLAEALASEAADIQTLATQVPKTVFRFMGATLFGISPIDAVQATVTSTWTAVDNHGYTILAGTQVGIRDADNNLVPFEVLADVTIPNGSTATATGGVTLLAVTAGATPNGIGVDTGVVELVDPLGWVLSVTQHLAVAGGVDAELDSDYLNRLSFELQTVSPRPILARDFSIMARNIAGVQRALTVDNYNAKHNLLTADEASFETGVSHWTNTANCAVAQSATQALDGTKSIRLTASSAADMAVELATANGKAVSPGDVVSALASFRAATTGRTVKIGIQFVDGGGAGLTTVYGSTAADSNAAWTRVSVQATAPANAAKAMPVLYVVSPANAEQHYIDEVQLRRGTLASDWVAGDTAETGVERMVTTFALDSVGAAIDSTHKTALQTYLDGLRELNFVVNVADPVREGVDVATTVTVATGYGVTDVQTRVQAAIASYISPATWGISPSDDPNNPITWSNVTIIRLYNLAAVIKNVAGVDSVTAITIGPQGGALAAADFTLGNVAPVPVLGTATVTAS